MLEENAFSRGARSLRFNTEIENIYFPAISQLDFANSLQETGVMATNDEKNNISLFERNSGSLQRNITADNNNFQQLQHN